MLEHFDHFVHIFSRLRFIFNISCATQFVGYELPGVYFLMQICKIVLYIFALVRHFSVGFHSFVDLILPVAKQSSFAIELVHFYQMFGDWCHWNGCSSSLLLDFGQLAILTKWSASELNLLAAHILINIHCATPWRLVQWSSWRPLFLKCDSKLIFLATILTSKNRPSEWNCLWHCLL